MNHKSPQFKIRRRGHFKELGTHQCQRQEMRGSWDSCEPEVGSNGQKFERWMAVLLHLYHILSFDRLASLVKVEALSLGSGFSSHSITVPGGFWRLWFKFLSTAVAEDKSCVPGNPLGVLESGGYRICCFSALLTYIFSPSPLLPDQTWLLHSHIPQTEMVPIPCAHWCSSSHYCWTLGLYLHGLLHKILLKVAPMYFLFFRKCDEGHLVTAGLWMRSEADYKWKD